MVEIKCVTLKMLLVTVGVDIFESYRGEVSYFQRLPGDESLSTKFFRVKFLRYHY